MFAICAPFAPVLPFFFFCRNLRLLGFTRLPTPTAQDRNSAASGSSQQDHRPEHHRTDDERSNRVNQTACSGLSRLRELCAKAAARRRCGQRLHLFQIHIEGRKSDQIIVMALRAGQRVRSRIHSRPARSRAR